MRLPRFLWALLCLLPLAACASDADGRATTHHATEDAVAAKLPEVRYYVIADT